MNRDIIKNFVESNPHLVDRKPTDRRGLYLIKYKKNVFYDNLWTPELLECRGTIVDENYNVISRPFTKVFNYLENGTKINRDTECVYVRKVNGFMCAVTTYNGEILISTTGSTTSKFVEMARKHLEPYLDKIKEHIDLVNSEGYGLYTYIFEIVDKEDPHIIAEEEGAYLIGYRHNEWDSGGNASEFSLDELAHTLGCKRPEWNTARFSGILKQVKTVKHEGFMVYGDYGTTLKLKSPYYLSKKALMRMGSSQIDKMFDKPEEFRKRLDEEFFSLHSSIIQSVGKEQWKIWSEQQRREFIEGWFEETLVTEN